MAAVAAPSDVQVHMNFVSPVPPKAIRVLGDPSLFPAKALKILGVEDIPSNVMKKSYNDDYLEAEKVIRFRKERIETISQLRPTKQQLSLPNPNARVSEKALLILGDEKLAEASRRVVTTTERREAKHHPKVFQILGEPVLCSLKVLRRLGSEMDSGQRRAQLRAAQAEKERQKQIQKRQLAATLKLLPTEEQLGLPPKAKSQQIPDKALRFFGEQDLEEMAKKIVTPQMRKNLNAKSLRLLGDSELLSDKQKQLLGSLDSAKPTTSHSWLSVVASVFRIRH